MENLGMLIVVMALPAAFCLLLTLSDVIMNILYFIFPALGKMVADEIERLERWQEVE